MTDILNIFQPQKTRGILLFLALSSYLLRPSPALAEAEKFFIGQDDILRGLHASYRLRFSEAQGIFRKMIADYPASPAGWFFSAAIDSGTAESDIRWRLTAKLYAGSAPPKREVKNADAISRNLNLTIERCRSNLEKNPENFESLFYMAGSYAFLARIEGLRSNYLSAMYFGKRSTKYFDLLRERYPAKGDASIGPGIYKYMVARLPKPMQWIVWMLGLSGSREEGLALIEYTYSHAAISRIEAADFLARAHWMYENDLPRALQWADILERETPDAPLADFTRLFVYHQQGNAANEEKTVRRLREYLGEADRQARADWEPLLLFALGTIYEKTGRVPEARRAFGEALLKPNLDPWLAKEISSRIAAGNKK